MMKGVSGCNTNFLASWLGSRRNNTRVCGLACFWGQVTNYLYSPGGLNSMDISCSLWYIYSITANWCAWV